MLENRNSHKDRTQGVFLDSLQGFATVVAVMLAILARRSYSPDLVQLVEVGWMIACYPFVFFAARASVSVALMTAGSFVAYRFL
ncbi:MAG: hypothetical protein Q4G22_14180 [Paracoccus sp. (in: a-proteobacteria)]|uniref:hypothetical protein n=1 Tax=Paracoccus sp. TaxID=267 RepID=UPI0026DFD88B|nr:hypothetical protein [Paracoccus sp. (in: a-proteobacteria)]MDO5632965.1 hypothetical protein [Paracoccus sp. (in: a-proteobacteria)]